MDNLYYSLMVFRFFCQASLILDRKSFFFVQLFEMNNYCHHCNTQETSLIIPINSACNGFSYFSFIINIRKKE